MGIFKEKAVQAYDNVKELTGFLYLSGDEIERILNLVQNNPEYFGDVFCGDSLLKVAADKLESLILRDKIRRAPIQPKYITRLTSD